uniref:Cation-transporting ATPase n=1 Tax=Rhabditophanes sp. KR3021 TaxID=114890 RepID=A0AC35U560_9BILA
MYYYRSKFKPSERSPLISSVKYRKYNCEMTDLIEATDITSPPPTETPFSCEIVDADETVTVSGYSKNLVKNTLTWILTILTLGLVQIVFYWYPQIKVKFTSSPCSLNNADQLLILDSFNNYTLKNVRNISNKEGNLLTIPSATNSIVNVESLRMFSYKKINYIWHPISNEFTSIQDILGSIDEGYFHEIMAKGTGSTTTEISSKLLIFGKNMIFIKLTNIFVLLFKEVISPFYMFQIFSVIIWYTDNYQYYATIIVFMSLLSVFSDVNQIRKQEKRLKEMVQSNTYCKAIRDGVVTELSSDELVPGDLIIVPNHGNLLPCDAVLMHGNIIVNESMLTGESVPVTKVPLVDTEEKYNTFSLKEHSKHILFCGTNVLQVRNIGAKPATAIVYRTAYSTLKGDLVRAIMYPKPVDLSFTKDLFKFVLFLLSIALCGFVYTVTIMTMRGSPIKKIIVRSLDIITIVVPPALPAAMSIGILNAQMRLRKKLIYCISPSTINTCGAINVVCFDKTGTLTEDGLDFSSFTAIHQTNNGVECSAHFGDTSESFLDCDLPQDSQLRRAAATCHSITKIDGELCGDPLDLIVFQKTEFGIDESYNDKIIEEEERFDMLQPTIVCGKVPIGNNLFRNLQLGIMKQFTFSSSLQRMAVLVHDDSAEEGKDIVLYVKGAPEMVASLCDPSSIPQNYIEVVNQYAQKGMRLIAVAYKTLDISYTKAQKIPRAEIECNLTMLGLICMDNRIKEQSPIVIDELNDSNIRTIMVTGDNLLTAISVAKECSIIQSDTPCFLVELDNNGELDAGNRHKITFKKSASAAIGDNVSVKTFFEQSVLELEFDSTYQLAIAGPTFAVICRDYPEYVDKLICVCNVFARMSPDQKQLLINRLQEVKYTVAMCGDGANDCAALKAAHAGISLSEAEASIAAPFTSKTPDIRCVPEIIREGRAALVTSFGVFKYMAAYSLTQFISIMQLYWLGTNLTDFQFLYIDLFLITLMALTFGATPATNKLSKRPPPTRLLSVGSVGSILGLLLLISATQVSVFLWTSYQQWFVPYSRPPTDDAEDKRSMQGTAIFFVSCFQYIALAIVYSKGHPYRKSILTNKWLCICLLIQYVATMCIVIFPISFVISFLEFDEIPYISDRIGLVVYAHLGGILLYLYEMLIVEHVLIKKVETYFNDRKMKNEKNDRSYSNILNQIQYNHTWLTRINHGFDDNDFILKDETLGMKKEDSPALSQRELIPKNEDD